MLLKLLSLSGFVAANKRFNIKTVNQLLSAVPVYGRYLTFPDQRAPVPGGYPVLGYNFPDA
jgi:hypothetical protein